MSQFATDTEREINAGILQGWIAKHRIELMQKLRETLSANLLRNNIILGEMDLVLREDCKPLLLPDCETYRVDGRVWTKDKTKMARFNTEFVGKIGMETELEDLLDLINSMETDIMLHLAAEDGGVE